MEYHWAQISSCYHVGKALPGTIYYPSNPEKKENIHKTSEKYISPDDFIDNKMHSSHFLSTHITPTTVRPSLQLCSDASGLLFVKSTITMKLSDYFSVPLYFRPAFLLGCVRSFMTYVNIGSGVLFLCKSGFKAFDILYFVCAVSDVFFYLSWGLICCLCVRNKLRRYTTLWQTNTHGHMQTKINRTFTLHLSMSMHVHEHHITLFALVGCLLLCLN